jgi:hypothetical protein
VAFLSPRLFDVSSADVKKIPQIKRENYYRHFVVSKAIASVIAAKGALEDPQAYGAKVADRVFPNIPPYDVGTTRICNR